MQSHITNSVSDFLQQLRNKTILTNPQSMLPENQQKHIPKEDLQQSVHQRATVREANPVAGNDEDHMQIGSQSELQAEDLFRLAPDTPKQAQLNTLSNEKNLKPALKSSEIYESQKKGAQEQIKPFQKMVTERDQNDQNKNIQPKTVTQAGWRSSQQAVKITKPILIKGKISQAPFQNQRMYEDQQIPVNREKTQKSVTFSGVLPLTVQVEKKWKDPIKNQKKGKFDSREEKVLSDAVGEFLAINGVSLEQFQGMLSEGRKSEKFSKKDKIFALLATTLPNRSPESCYKFLKRNFNTLNRKGKWTEDEIERLKQLVQKHGRKWTLISKELKRTADNCYDKYRELGQQNMEDRVKGIWRLRELVDLLKLTEVTAQVKFLDRRVDNQLEKEDLHDRQEKEQVANRKYNSKNFIFHNFSVLKPYISASKFQKINTAQVRWAEIASKLKTRNILDCRNKVVQLLQVFFHSTPKEIDEKILEFLLTKKYESAQQINWKEWKEHGISWEEAKNRFMILKKQVEGRRIKGFREIVCDLKERVEKRKTPLLVQKRK